MSVLTWLSEVEEFRSTLFKLLSHLGYVTLGVHPMTVVLSFVRHRICYLIAYQQSCRKV